MPNMQVKIPKGAFPGSCREALMRHLDEAAARAEQMPDDPSRRSVTWVQIDEVEADDWRCGAQDLSARLLPCLVQIHLPAGVLDDAARELYARLVHQALQRALPTDERRQLASSVILQEVPDGAWAANGRIWRLPDFARAAGYIHLQELAASTPAPA